MDNKQSEVFKEAFSLSIELMGDYIIKIAIVEFPFLALPGIKQVFSYIVKKVLSKVKDEGELTIDFAFIDRDMDNKKKEYKEAIKELKQVLSSESTEEQKNEAVEKTKERLRNLIRFPSR